MMSASVTVTTPDAETEKKRKRPRAARACENCRAKKYGCDELYPCTQCKKQKVECIFKGAEKFQKRLRSSSYVAELERKVEELSARALSNSSERATEPAHFVGNMSTQGVSSHMNNNGIYNALYPTEKGAGIPILPPASTWRNRNHLPPTEDNGTTSAAESIHDPDEEVRDINHHTKGIEFHGNTSSMAFLSLLQTQNQAQSESSLSARHPAKQKSSLVSTLHNVAFSPDSNIPSTTEPVNLQNESYYFRQSHIFLDGYFENLHFIHPILNREEFLAQCEDLWFGRVESQKRSFIALYYSILSLGALVRVWDEETLEGMNRFEWSRKLFNQARIALGELRSTNDLESVQSLIFMAKVCQNELNPHLAYMYLGMAVRASLSAGLHREPTAKPKPSNQFDASNAISKTWWGLYSLEMEMSFSLGRPDSLGLDEYHNRLIPPADDTEIAILPVMIPFARITRKVSVAIYLSKSSMREKIAMASQIEAEMDTWLHSLPEKIRPGLIREENGIRILKDPKWARRQRLVLQIRYCNVKMVLYRPFLTYAAQSHRRLPVELEATVTKCIDAAKMTIEVMHDTFCHHVFFRTWWYNTTYILYAASIILCYATQAATPAEKADLFKLVDMTIEILKAMDESVVAGKAGEMIQQILSQAREHTAAVQDPEARQQSAHNEQQGTSDFSINAMLESELPVMNMDEIFDFDEAIVPMDETNFLLWTDLNGDLGSFGA